jgi:hypothetical protein
MYPLKEKIDEKGFSDGEMFHFIMRMEDFCKDQRCVPPKSILREIDVNRNDFVAIDVDKKHKTISMSGVPFTSKGIDVNSDKAEELLDEIIADAKDDQVEIIKDGARQGIRHVVQVKSQGRLCSRKRIYEIFGEIGAQPEDWIAFKYIKDKQTKKASWMMRIVRHKDIINMFFEEEE